MKVQIKAKNNNNYITTNGKYYYYYYYRKKNKNADTFLCCCIGRCITKKMLFAHSWCFQKAYGIFAVFLSVRHSEVDCCALYTGS